MSSNKILLNLPWLLIPLLIIVEGGDSSGRSETVETPQKRCWPRASTFATSNRRSICFRSERGGSTSPAERVRI